MPEGQKSYSKTKGIKFAEFAPMIEWWDNRKENEVAWCVPVKGLKAGFDLDVKNPRRKEEKESLAAAEVISLLDESMGKASAILSRLRRHIQ